MNASDTEPERHLQIWLYPRTRGEGPACELVRIDEDSKRDRWRLIASPDGREGSVTVRQDARIFASLLSEASTLRYTLEEHRLGYLHVVTGDLRLGPQLQLHAGDGLRFTHHEALSIAAASSDTEVLLFDL